MDLNTIEAITVLRITPVNNAGSLRAFAVVRVGDFEISDCRVIQQKGQRAYLAWPQRQSGGQWYPVIKTTPELRERVQALVLAEWRNQEPRS